MAWVVIILYLLTTLLQAMGLVGKLQNPQRYLFLFGISSVLLHAVLLHQWIDLPRGQNLAFANMFSLLAWLIALLTLFIAIRKPVFGLSLLVFPLAIISIFCVLFLPGQESINKIHDPKQLFHILLAVLTFGVLCVAGLQAVLLVVQERQLRQQKSTVWMKKLPPLETLEILLFQFIGFGFLLLSILITTGWFFFHDMLNKAFMPKIYLTLLAWIIFGLLLIGRHCFGWRGQKAIYGTLIGVALLLIIYFGSVLLWGALL